MGRFNSLINNKLIMQYIFQEITQNPNSVDAPVVPSEDQNDNSSEENQESTQEETPAEESTETETVSTE